MGLTEEIQLEQAYLDVAYARLDALRESSAELAQEPLGQGRGGLLSDRVDRDARVELALRRRAALSIGELSLCFGRLDLDSGDRWYIGRMGVLDEHGDVLIVDWRAPIAESFYRATSRDRFDVTLRRHVRMNGRRVTGLDDELLTGPGTAKPDHLVGEGALMAALSTARTGRMSDIVATIQADQDAAIRAPWRGPLVVQGGPGTGKTAVALHRAAFLLYAHRFPLASQGVLVVGPNPTFCRYVDQVLPGLGETGVRLATPAELVGGRTASVVDAPDVAASKASGAMAQHLKEVLSDHQRPLDETVTIGLGMHLLTVSPPDSSKLIESARQTGSYNAGRTALEGLVLRYLLRQAERAGDRLVRTGRVARRDVLPSRSDNLETLRRSPSVAELVDRMWPKLTPEQVVAETLAAQGLGLSDEEWSEHDLALLDEATALLGPGRRPTRSRRRRTSGTSSLDNTLDQTLAGMGLLPECPVCESELSMSAGRWQCEGCGRSWRLTELVPPETVQQIREIMGRIEQTQRPVEARPEQTTFGHVIVDEAQDLTPMQWRMLARRCPTGSMTIVGDLGQSKYDWCPTTWADACATAAPGSPHRQLELTVNYRTPTEVMRLATAVLAEHAPHLVAPSAVRSTGIEPQAVRVDLDGDVLQVARKVAVDESAAVRPGKVAIIEAASAPGAAGMSPLSRRAKSSTPNVIDADVAELDISDAKGLEFDSVVIVEPADFSSGELYVALTRTTSRLVLVHRQDLPATLRLVEQLAR